MFDGRDRGGPDVTHQASFRGASKTRTSDVQLHIGESRDSGFDASHRPGMTAVVTSRNLPASWPGSWPCRRSSDRKIFGKSDCRMLGRRIGGTSDLRKKSGGGNRVEKIPLPARLHARNQMPR